jgi:hypothetical protein
MTKSLIVFARHLLLAAALCTAVVSANATRLGESTDPDSTTIKIPELGHLSCVIRADTNCVDHTVTLQAWTYYLFTGVSDPIVATWSTGVTAHKIIVDPPGIWSYDASIFGCEPVHQFNSVTYEKDFYEADIDIEGAPTGCPNSQSALTVNTQGYTFSDFEWSPAYPELTPRPVGQTGLYSLTVTDQLGCTYSDAVMVSGAGSANCSDACVYCDIDGATGLNNGSSTGGTIYCSAIDVQNAMWFGFVAGTDTIGLNLTSSNCQNGDGLQLAVLEDCSADAIACNAGCPGCGSIDLQLEYTQFVPGKTYYLVVDGFNTDVCDFTIDVIKGSTIAPVPALASTPAGPTTICPGGTAVYKIPAVNGAGYYHWSAPPGAVINGGAGQATLDAPAGTEVTITFGASGGDVCVFADNACQDSVGTACLSVSTAAIPATILPTSVICFEDLPYVWTEDPFTILTAPGTYSLASTAYVSLFGCDSIVRQTIVVRPAKITNLAPRFLCKGECFTIGGDDYCDPGQYAAVLESYEGCDSTVTFAIIVLDPSATISGPTVIECGETSVALQSASAVSNSWTNEQGMIVGTSPALTVTQPGRYILSVTTTAGGVSCTARDTVLVTKAPEVSGIVITGAENGCTENPLVISGAATGLNLAYTWSGPNGFTTSGQNATVTETGTYTLLVTDTDGCTGSATTLVNTVGGTPEVTADGAEITCTQTSVVLNGGTTATGASFAWTGPNGFTSEEEDPSVTEPGIYILTVTTVGGCTGVATATLALLGDLPDVAAFGGTLTCATTSVQLQGNSNTSGVSFDWAGPNGFTSSQEDPEVTAAGTYELVVTAPNGCSSTVSVAVQENKTPPVVTVTGGVINCLQLPTLTATANVASPEFSWQGPDNFTATTASVEATLVGNYTVVATDPANGCTATAATTVVRNDVLPEVFAEGDTVTCIQTMPQLNGGSNTPGATFSWSGPDGFESQEEDPAAGAPGVYILTVTNPAGCTSTTQAIVDVSNDSPTVSVADVAILCNQYPTLSCITNATIALFTWTGPNGFFSPNPSTVVQLTGVYEVTVVNLENGCTASATATVSQGESMLEIITDGIVQPNIGQNNGSISISINGFIDTTIVNWFLNDTPFASTEDINNLAPGTYKVVVTDAYGCTSETTFVLEALSGTNNALEAGWQVMPNPASGLFRVQSQTPIALENRLMIFDYSGRLVLEQAMAEGVASFTIDLTLQPAGVYLMELRSAEKSVWAKLVVQK